MSSFGVLEAAGTFCIFNVCIGAKPGESSEYGVGINHAGCCWVKSASLGHGGVAARHAGSGFAPNRDGIFGHMSVQVASVPLDAAPAFPVFGGSADAAFLAWNKGPSSIGLAQFATSDRVFPAACVACNGL